MTFRDDDTWLNRHDENGTISNLRPTRSAAETCLAETKAVSLKAPDTPALCGIVKGTQIQTDQGNRPIHRLRPGDLVMTADHGLQPLRWVGQSTVSGKGDLAPVGILGSQRNPAEGGVLVAPDHRLLRSGYGIELLFGASEAFVTARDMIDDDLIIRVPVRKITYVQLMFDAHEVIFANGVATESLFADGIVTDQTGTTPQTVHHGQTARLCLKPDEAALLTPDGRLQAEKGLQAVG